MYVESELNRIRAAQAEDALVDFACGNDQRLELEPDAVLSDLLCDLMHYAEQQKLDFARCLARGQANFREESGGQV